MQLSDRDVVTVYALWASLCFQAGRRLSGPTNGAVKSSRCVPLPRSRGDRKEVAGVSRWRRRQKVVRIATQQFLVPDMTTEWCVAAASVLKLAVLRHRVSEQCQRASYRTASVRRLVKSAMICISHLGGLDYLRDRSTSGESSTDDLGKKVQGVDVIEVFNRLDFNIVHVLRILVLVNDANVAEYLFDALLLRLGAGEG